MSDAGADLAEAIGRAILGAEPEESLALDHRALVRRAARAEVVARDLLSDVVRSARAAGQSWGAIGAELGISRQAAQQRFGAEEPERPGTPDEPETRWLGPVTAFDEMAELELAGRLGWRTEAAGLLRHRVRRTSTQWETRRVAWTRPVAHYEQDGWVVGCRAFPWLYLVRDLGRPAGPEGSGPDQKPMGSPA